MARKRKQKKDIMDQNWNCLSSLKTYFETSKEESVVSFEGHSLTTKKHVYALYDGKLSRKPR